MFDPEWFGDKTAVIAKMRLDELETAYAISQLGALAGLNHAHRPSLIKDDALSLSVARALILADSGPAFLAKFRADTNAPRTQEQNHLWGDQIAVSIMDQPDEFKAQFARFLEENGESEIATKVASDMSEFAFYQAFQSRRGVEIAHVPGLDRQDWRDIYRADFQTPQQGLFLKLAHAIETPERVPGLLEVVHLYLDARSDGVISPAAPAENTWLFVYEELVKIWGQDTTQNVFAKFDVSPEFRHYAGRGDETINRMIALRAIEDYATVQTDVLPARPPLLPPQTDWESWRMIAEAVRHARLKGMTKLYDLQLSNEQRKAAAELLHRADLSKFGVTLVSHAKHLYQAGVQITDNDFLRRLDRACFGYTRYPGESVFLRGRPIYKFPQKLHP